MKRFTILFFLLVFLFSFTFAGEEEILKKTFELYSQKKYVEALEMIERGIKEIGKTRNLLSVKFRILMELQKFNEALDIAIKKEEISMRKSPWNCIDVAIAYAHLNEKEKAITWLKEAVNRGFISYQELYGKDFESLKNEKEFNEIIAQIKEKVGIGKKAKDFTVTLFSGDEFTLSAQKGKVILIDFWASWCGPCRKEMPNLKKYYNEFKDKGFEIIGISLDRDKLALEEFLKKENVGWKISFTGKGWDDDTARLYSVNSIPSTWLVDKKGMLRYFGLRGEELREAISELIAEE